MLQCCQMRGPAPSSQRGELLDMGGCAPRRPPTVMRPQSPGGHRRGLAKTKLAVRSNAATNARPSSTLAFSVENAAASCSSAERRWSNDEPHFNEARTCASASASGMTCTVPLSMSAIPRSVSAARASSISTSSSRLVSNTWARAARSPTVSCRASASSDSSLLPTTHASAERGDCAASTVRGDGDAARNEAQRRAPASPLRRPVRLRRAMGLLDWGGASRASPRRRRRSSLAARR